MRAKLPHEQRKHPAMTDPRERSNGERIGPAPAFSLVIPALNEAGRLPPYLQSIGAYCPRQFGSDYEVIVVDDGGSDNLAGVLAQAWPDWPQLRVLRHRENRGKGAAVRTGVIHSRGNVVLFADADGAAPIEEEARLRAALAAGADMAVGSRLLRCGEAHCRRPLRRAISGRLFAAVARRTLGLPVRDTQCGFKMFAGNVAHALFAACREEGFLFDLELLMLATAWKLRIDEVPITWREQPGSRLNFARECVKIAKGLRRLRLRRKSLPPAPADLLCRPDSR